MDTFLSELELLLEFTDITKFENEFKSLVHTHRMDEGVMDIANIVAHNYNCHKYNRENAIIHNTKEWEKYNA